MGSGAKRYGVIPGNRWATDVERVGGRRRLRGEVLVLVAGLIFLAAALLKPWAGLAPAVRPSSSPTSSPPGEIAAAPSPAMPSPSTTAAPTPVRAQPIPPYDYRWGFPFPAATVAPGGSQPGVAVATNYSWSAVDWSALSTTDSDATWGFAAVVMTNRADGLVGPSTLSPTTSWVSLGSPSVYSAVPLVQGQNVYAIAVTWPTDLAVSRVTFVYMGGPEHPVYLPPAAFLPGSRVIPIPAGSATSASAVSQIATNHIRSGEFLIPPTSASSIVALGSTSAAWRSSPWPWPYGTYLVAVTSATGTKKVVLDLLLTD
jgi:hypothetical protein